MDTTSGRGPPPPGEFKFPGLKAAATGTQFGPGAAVLVDALPFHLC